MIVAYACHKKLSDQLSIIDFAYEEYCHLFSSGFENRVPKCEPFVINDFASHFDRTVSSPLNHLTSHHDLIGD